MTVETLVTVETVETLVTVMMVETLVNVDISDSSDISDGKDSSDHGDSSDGRDIIDDGDTSNGRNISDGGDSNSSDSSLVNLEFHSSLMGIIWNYPIYYSITISMSWIIPVTNG